MSGWASLKAGFEYSRTNKNARITNLSKIQLFNARTEFHTAKHLPAEDLHNISFYAFWRLFDVRSGHVSRRQREAIVSLTGTGWPSHAQRTHPQHLQYAKTRCTPMRRVKEVVEQIISTSAYINITMEVGLMHYKTLYPMLTMSGVPNGFVEIKKFKIKWMCSMRRRMTLQKMLQTWRASCARHVRI